ncbi:hypothetical protein WBJ53_16095 [Spirosoma sp. SC4-14]|uniref:hypothetical protein n=1 Tax=Spirosoma sp. SC4-14 TaxID=3128900 RepID=UPI0030D0B454
MKISLLIGLLIGLSDLLFTANAQSVSSVPNSQNAQGYLPRWIVKFAPLSLIDPSNTIQFGVERVVSQQNSLQAEFGYGWQGINAWNRGNETRYSNFEVWRGRAEWRHYWRRAPAPIGGYTAIEGLYRRDNAMEHGTVGIGSSLDIYQYQYYQMYSLPISNQVWALTVKVGRQFSMSANNRLLGDFYMGLGYRTGTTSQPHRPDGYNYYYPSGLIIDPFNLNRYPNLNASFGIKVGYAF